jgi:hypothetical protein
VDENIGRPAGERWSNSAAGRSPSDAEGRQEGMTHAAYATMLELGLAALERDDDMDPCLLERVRQRFEALAAASATVEASVIRFEQRRP